MLTKYIRVDMRNNSNNFIQIEDLRNTNSIAQQIINQSINTILTTSIYSSFSEAINDLFTKNIITPDQLDEIIFKRWIAMDNTLYLLENLIREHQLFTINDIKNFINNITYQQLKDSLFNTSISISSPKHLEQELGIQFKISIDLFFVRFMNNTRFFDNEVKIYIDNQSKVLEYILNDLKNNVDTYINKIYITHYETYI